MVAEAPTFAVLIQLLDLAGVRPNFTPTFPDVCPCVAESGRRD
jgi:hypothetical protein